MNLEEAMQANTVAIYELIKQLATQSVAPAKKADIKPIPKVKVVTEDVPLVVDDATYIQVRERILELAKGHGDEIREICKANGVKRPSELLENPEDFDSPVSDQGKLNAIHSALLKLGA